ncbi:hypothetical protein VU04_06340 [Desulfobulbus sp. TB]|nr:hypothetical protein [Desulfobulbus sp. TB]
MTTPAVIQLQEYATDEQHDVSELLRKALLIATKLKLFDFKEWISNELNGYKDKNLTNASVPKYRIVPCDLKVIDPYRGLLPFQLVKNDPDMAKLDEECHKVYIHDSVRSLQEITIQPSGNLTINFHPSTEDFLLSIQQGGMPLRPVRVVQSYQITSIIDTVRTQVLEWALVLEQEGILGEGLTFTSKEKEIAEQSVTINNIENFQGVLGNVSNSTVTQTNHLVINSDDFNSLAEHLRSQGVANQDIEELQQAVENDPAPTQPNAFGSHVSTWMGKMMIKAADGTWNVGVATAGGLLANALGKYYGL